MKKNLAVLKTMMILTLPLMLVILSCGGGGGGGGSDDGGSGGSSGTPATVNQTSARQALGVVQFGSTVGALYDDTGLRFMAGTGGSRTAFAESMTAAVLRMTKQKIMNSKQRAGSVPSVEENCPHGGSITVSGSWTGPDEPETCSDIANLNATVRMNSCAADYGTTINGEATVSLSGSACAPSAISIGYHGINFSNSDEQVSVQINDLSIALTDITWDSHQSYITHGRVVMTGTADGTVEGLHYQAQYDHFTEIMTTEDNVNFSAEYSGSISGDCLDGWITVETLAPIEFSTYDDCPSAGQLRLSGDVDILVTINEDGTITVGDQIYTDCNDFEMSCAP